MKLRVVSDLHLDGCMMRPRPDVGAVAALVAGDTVNGSKADQIVPLLEHLFPEPQILVIPGNHEGYRRLDFEAVCAELAAACEGSRVVPLWRAVHELPGGVAVLGATLWTDFDLFGEHRREETMGAAGAAMMDYRLVGKGGVPIRPADSLAWHREDLAWLRGQAAARKGQRMVCMTHHGPRRDSVAKKYAMDPASGGFVSNLPDSDFEPFELWVHGHVHTSFDYPVGRCRVVCNPRGYTSVPEAPLENPWFDPDFVAEI